ncbi:MAG: B12-binding domain-containing radical SAM protein [Verrucomicrobia bacterium]|nr:B12-binding domain-containing radical SAM protein [Verrucomicrobiota bacterium]
MNIVLATPPIPGVSCNTGSFPPLGLMYLAAGAKQLPGVRVKLVDAFCEGLDMDRAADAILSHSPDVVGLSVASRGLRNLAALLDKLKKARPGILTVAGGIHPTLFDRLLLKEIPALDVVVRGEGDRSFPELCRRLVAGEPIADVPGVSCRVNGEIQRGEPQLIEDLDALPFPDRSLLNARGYGQQWFGHSLPHMPRFTTIFSSRGCPFTCTFCADVKLCHNRLRIRSAESVFQELAQVSREGHEFVIFFDDSFTGDIARVEKLCHLILQQKLNLRLAFAGGLQRLSQSTLDLMHRAGFDLAFVGVESGSDEQLKRYRKPATTQAMISGIARAKKAGMLILASFITGSKEESEADHEASKAFVRKTLPHICEINSLMVHPGSLLWDELNGPGDPETLEASESRLVSRFPGQMEKKIIKDRAQDFHRAFQRSWLHWRRISDFFSLWFRNPLFARVMKLFVLNPGPILKLLTAAKARD